jgi:lysozyme
MKTSQAGIALITEFEGCRTTAYRDTGGVLTIGFGHTGPEVKPGMVWTREHCVQQLRSDLGSRETILSHFLDGIETTQHQFDALISLGYNIGMGALHSSDAFKYHCRGQHTRAADAFLNWSHVNGRVVDGLVRRRKAERELYVS